MKKSIILSLAVFFALVLVSCKSDRQKCKNEGKVWLAEEQKCVSTEQAECEKKEDMAWNEEENKCEEKSNEQKECEAQENMAWNAEENKCEEQSSEQAKCEAQKGKKWENGQCIDQLFTILYKTSSGQHYLLVAIDGRQRVQLTSTGECAKVAASVFNDLKISILKHPGDRETLCDNNPGDTAVGSSPSCPAGNYEVWYNHRPSGPPNTPAIGYTLTKKDQAAECKEVVDTLQ
ncbi:MAG: hypothetical protein OXH36_00135 [Bdellovibrionales bacterium]|nr:hypothetical protein [Bdellovibrionales bacterium]